MLAYCAAVWFFQGRAWAPPTLLSPRSLSDLLAPLRPRPAPEAAPAIPEAPPLRPAPRPVEATPDPGSWASLIERFRELRAGGRDKIRVVHLGDSEIIGDGTSNAIRQRLTERFGWGGLGFGAPMRPVPYYQLSHWSHQDADGVEIEAYPLGEVGRGRYGPGGVAFRARAGTVASVTLDHPRTGGCRLRFFYDPVADGGRIDLSADGEPLESLDGALAPGATPAIARYEATRSPCPRKLGLRTQGGYTRLYGWSVEYDSPGVVYATLGVVGAQLRHLRHYQPAHLVESLAALEPDLVVLAFGLNLASMSVPPPPSYEAEIGEVLRNLRKGLPGAACLVVGPYPVGRAEGSHPEARNAARVAEAQRRVAEAVGCMHLDRFALAGGATTAARWRATTPRILSGDYRHLTHHGAERMGDAIGVTLLTAIDGRPAPRRAFLLGEGG